MILNGLLSINKPPSSEKVLPEPKGSPFKVPEGAKMIGNYLLGKNIGQGSFGKVHLGMHIPTGQKIAVKIIQKSKILSRDIFRVKNEIKILSNTRHRHLIQLYQIIETEKSLLLVMQFMPGGQLFKHIIKQKRIQQKQACSMFQQIISAVQYLHKNGIAHRDLKPQNILIDDDRQLKIIDFGLSAIYTKNQLLKSSCGSPCYTAPEVIQAKKGYSPLLADIWSCGIILFAMLCGYLPFCDGDTSTLFKKILSGQFKIPTFISASAKNLLENILVLNPSKRFTIDEIKNHEWFHQIEPSKVFGVNKDERIVEDVSLVQKVKDLGFNGQKLLMGLNKNQKNRQTSTYYILMKKLIKCGQKIDSYIGNNDFNPKKIQKIDEKDDDDTKSLSDPFTVMAPELPDKQIPEYPSIAPGHNPEDEWWAEESSKHSQPKEIDTKKLIQIASNILELFVESAKYKEKVTFIMEMIEDNRKENPEIVKNEIEKKRKFYDGNLKHMQPKVGLKIQVKEQMKFKLPCISRKDTAQKNYQFLFEIENRKKTELTIERRIKLGGKSLLGKRKVNFIAKVYGMKIKNKQKL